MKILIFGASGMVGQAVLRECLLDGAVTAVKVVGRTRVPSQNEKLHQLTLEDLFRLDIYASDLTGYDACFFSIGATAAGSSEARYRRVNYDLPVYVASLLAKLNPNLVFIYVSGQGTDSSEKGRIMWARVKGATENAIMSLPIKAACMIRLAGLIPKNGETSSTPLYRYLYAVLRPLTPLFERFLPDYVTTTEQLGRAVLNLAKNAQGKRIIENKSIAELAEG